MKEIKTVEDWLGSDNQLGIDIFNRKYKYNNETFVEWLDRVSGNDDELRRLILEKKFLFGGRALSNRGTDDNSSMFNCYSAGYCPDDLVGIMQLNTNLALTYKAQGGQGVSLSMVRPKGTPIGTRYESDGIIPFLELFNQTTATISQGSSRKGALMVSLDIRHKESEEFIRIKSGENRISKANLSLEIDDEFMEAVKSHYTNGETIVFHEKRVYNGHTIEYDITPIKLYKLLIKECYDWADPACLFTNRFRNYNIMEFDDEYIVETSNPCGEQPLKKDSCCNLGSLNLSEFVLNPYTKESKIDYNEFEKSIIIAINALDILIDENANNHAIPEQKQNSLDYRNIGLGCMGYGTMLFKLGIKYGSNEAKELTDRLFHCLFKTAVFASNNLAKEKGRFPKYKDVVWDSTIIQAHFTKEEIKQLEANGLRNCSLISIAPTGSIATMLGITGGCEPEFAIKYQRKTESLDGQKEKYYEVNCKSLTEYQLINQTQNVPDYFVSSTDISWKDRVETQAIMQNHVDTAISSTVNLSNSSTLEDVEKLYLCAWEQGLKGITIFRNGCKREGILTTTANSTVENQENKFDYIEPITKDELGETYGTNVKRKVACGKLYINICRDKNGNLVEIFINTGKGGICQSNTNAISRLVSMGLRSGIKTEEIIDQLKGIVCPACKAMKDENLSGLSCADVIAKTLLEEYNKDEIIIKKTKKKSIPKKKITKTTEIINEAIKCRECGGKLKFEGGCQTCLDCGWSKCS